MRPSLKCLNQRTLWKSWCTWRSNSRVLLFGLFRYGKIYYVLNLERLQKQYYKNISFKKRVSFETLSNCYKRFQRHILIWCLNHPRLGLILSNVILAIPKLKGFLLRPKFDFILNFGGSTLGILGLLKTMYSVLSIRISALLCLHLRMGTWKRVKCAPSLSQSKKRQLIFFGNCEAADCLFWIHHIFFKR